MASDVDEERRRESIEVSVEVSERERRCLLLRGGRAAATGVSVGAAL